MKKTIASMFETGVLHLVVLCLVFALALCFAGCSVTKINYEKDEKGVVSYRLYRNDHWLKTSGTGISGGMTKDGKFEFAAEGLERSPSEEFNRTMQTYTSALVQFMQIAAAAYNPSSSAAAAGKEATTVNVQVPSTGEAAANVSRGDAETRSVASQSSTGNNAASDPHAAECTDGSCSDGACTDGSCNPNEVK